MAYIELAPHGIYRKSSDTDIQEILWPGSQVYDELLRDRQQNLNQTFNLYGGQIETLEKLMQSLLPDVFSTSPVFITAGGLAPGTATPNPQFSVAVPRYYWDFYTPSFSETDKNVTTTTTVLQGCSIDDQTGQPIIISNKSVTIIINDEQKKCSTLEISADMSGFQPHSIVALRIPAKIYWHKVN